MYENDLVSIVIPSLNSGKFIKKTLESVINQTYQHLEVIIVDNNSEDETLKVVEAFSSKDQRFRLISLDSINRAGPTRNIGIQVAKGRYLALLDSDDLWNSNKIEVQLAFMKQQKLAFSFTGYEVIDANDDHICNIDQVPIQLTYHDFLKNTCIATSSVMVDRSIVSDFQFQDRPISEDYPTWLNTLKKGHASGGVSGVYLRYRVVPSSLSSKKMKASKMIWHIFRHEERLPIVYATYCFACYAIRALVKNKKMKRI